MLVTSQDCKRKSKRGGMSGKGGGEKSLAPPTITAKVGTIKRKRQIRNCLELMDRGYSDDLFESTPFKKRVKSVQVRIRIFSTPLGSVVKGFFPQFMFIVLSLPSCVVLSQLFLLLSLVPLSCRTSVMMTLKRNLVWSHGPLPHRQRSDGGWEPPSTTPPSSLMS